MNSTDRLLGTPPILEPHIAIGWYAGHVTFTRELSAESILLILCTPYIGTKVKKTHCPSLLVDLYYTLFP